MSERIEKFLILFFKLSFIFAVFLSVITVVYNLDVLRYAAHNVADGLGFDSIFAKLILIIVFVVFYLIALFLLGFFFNFINWCHILYYIVDPNQYKELMSKIISVEYNYEMDRFFNGFEIGEGLSIGHTFIIMGLISTIYILIVSYLLIKCLKGQEIKYLETFINSTMNKIKWWG